MTMQSQALRYNRTISEIFVRCVALANKDLRNVIDDIDAHLETQYIIEENFLRCVEFFYVSHIVSRKTQILTVGPPFLALLS